MLVSFQTNCIPVSLKAIQMLLEQLQGRTETITTVITPKLLIQD